MKGTNILTLAITLTLGVILAGSLLMPVIEDAQTDLGDPTTLTNNSPIVLREVKDGDVLKCVSTYESGTSTSTDVWSLNDEPITNLSGSTLTWNVGIMSDAVYMQIYDGTNPNVASYWDMTVSTPTQIVMSSGSSTDNERSHTFEFSNGTVTYTKVKDGVTTTDEYAYTWGYVICPYADGKYCAAVSGGVGYVNNVDEIVLCGAYTTGDLDTMYYHHNGVDYVSNSDYTMTFNVTKVLHTGTTDIYDATVSVTISENDDDETFTPYRILVPYKVTGHAPTGAAYDLLGALPIMVIIGLVLAATAAIFTKRDD